MIPLTNEENRLYCIEKICYPCNKEFSTITVTLYSKNTIKYEIIVITPKNIEVLLIIHVT